MLTLKFENDPRSSDGGATTFMIEAASFRTRDNADGSVDVLIENANGVEIAHPIGGTLGTYDRCFVMNEAGKTVAKYLPRLARPSEPVMGLSFGMTKR